MNNGWSNENDWNWALMVVIMIVVAWLLVIVYSLFGGGSHAL